MKKILWMFLYTIILSVCFCPVAGASDAAKTKVVTTIFPQYDFARAIAGDAVDLVMVLRPGAESHSFDPTPHDIRLISGCDVFIYVGGLSEGWAVNILNSLPDAARERIRIVALMDIVESVEEETVEGMQEEKEAENGGVPEYDEHVWTSPKNARKIVSALTDVLCEVDGRNEPAYRANSAGYLGQLDELDKKIETIVSNAKRHTIMFGDRFPFRYLVDAYGLDYFAAFPGCSTETEANAATIAFLINKTREWGIPVVFYREFSNGNVARSICESTGARVMLLHSCHNISRDDFNAGVTYIDIMTRNADALCEALN
ncbi:MAG: metal ABC transporter substrate-binding protein [Synergistaceae bacterium]|nr:metal ABC transporter substrate-binding protein [Synergistaceae bacterium]